MGRVRHGSSLLAELPHEIDKDKEGGHGLGNDDSCVLDPQSVHWAQDMYTSGTETWLFSSSSQGA